MEKTRGSTVVMGEIFHIGFAFMPQKCRSYVIAQAQFPACTINTLRT